MDQLLLAGQMASVVSWSGPGWPSLAFLLFVWCLIGPWWWIVLIFSDLSNSFWPRYGPLMLHICYIRTTGLLDILPGLFGKGGQCLLEALGRASSDNNLKLESLSLPWLSHFSWVIWVVKGQALFLGLDRCLNYPSCPFSDIPPATSKETSAQMASSTIWYL